VAEGTFRLRVTYAKSGSLRYLSHLEVTRACERCVRRAGLTYAVTQGFNPRMKAAFGPALPVGTAGLAEAYDVWLTRFVPPAQALAALRAVSSADLMPENARYMPETAPSLTAEMTVAEYSVDVEGRGVGPEKVREGLEAVRADGSITVEHKGANKVFDLAVFLPKEPTVGPHDRGASVQLTTRKGASGTLRPEMLIARALERVSLAADVVRVTRTRLRPEGTDA
jgi:radical SAM-linked protein